VSSTITAGDAETSLNDCDDSVIEGPGNNRGHKVIVGLNDKTI
jgi:hypothetical protein